MLRALQLQGIRRDHGRELAGDPALALNRSAHAAIRSDATIEDFYSNVEETPDGEGRRLRDLLAAWATKDVIGSLKSAGRSGCPSCAGALGR
jgi:hypothetical protein